MSGRRAVQRVGPELRTPAAVDVFTRILTHGPIGRVEIGRQTALSAAAVTKAVAPLIDAGYVRVTPSTAQPSTAGRPVHPLHAVPTSLYVIGIKVGTDELAGVVTGLTAEIVHEAHAELEQHDPATVVAAVAAMITELAGRLGRQTQRLAGACVTVSGDVDAAGGVVRHSPLLGWRDVELAAQLTSTTGVPTMIDNDVRALTVAEHWFGVGRDSASFAVVTIGSGIGCGLHLNGDVVSGGFGVAGELGHLPLGPADARCVCGRYGCVEAVASTSAVLRRIRTSSQAPRLTASGAVDRARAGDPRATAAFDLAADTIGAAIAAMVNLVGPDLVLVCGEGVADYDLYAGRIRTQFAQHAFGAAANCRIVTRPDTITDWARGAAATVIRSVIRSPGLLDVRK